MGFNRHRRDQNEQVWGGQTYSKPVSYLVKQVLDEPEYNCNTDPSKPGRVYGPATVATLMRPHAMHSREQYKAIHDAKVGSDRPLLWARDSNGMRCTYKTQPSLPGSPAANAEQAREACRYYPHQPDIIMKTAMNFVDEFKPKRLNRETVMFTALGIKEIADNILERLPFASRAEFSRTCSDAMLVTSSFQTLYDLARNNIQYSEYTEEEFEKMKQAHIVPEDQQQRGTKYLLVSQTHLEYIDKPSDKLDPTHPDQLLWPGYRRFATYCMLGESVGRLTRAILLRGANIELLTLHRVPFADGKVIAGWVSHMPKLKRLEIVGCEMVRFHYMAPFYRDIAKIQKTHGTKITVEISPLHETGPRWENDSNVDSWYDDRVGEYVVCWADVGIKIPSAVAVELYWHLFPAMVEAGQWETIFDLTCATRKYLERLPMPFMAIPILISVFSEWMDIKRDIEKAETKWAEESPPPPPAAAGGNAGTNVGGNAQGIGTAQNTAQATTQPEDPQALATPNPAPGLYDPHHWSQNLRLKVTRFMVKRNHALAFAMFGTRRWIETRDQSEMSTDTQCRTDNYNIWGADKNCHDCKYVLPNIAYTAGGVCENCRLMRACNCESDHLKRFKKDATQALGFEIQPSRPEEQQNGLMGTQAPLAGNQPAQLGNPTIQATPATDDEDDSICDITRSNFPQPEAFWQIDDEGNRVSLVNLPRDLILILSNAEGPLADFFRETLTMDIMEASHALTGHIGFRQKKHPSADHLGLNQSARQMAGHYMYRQCLSVEDFIKTPNGHTPTDTQLPPGGF